jgi:hypothetical protein
MLRLLLDALFALVVEETVKKYIPRLLSQAWLLILGYFTWELLNEYGTNVSVKIATTIGAKNTPLSYVVVAVLGAIVFVFYWWGIQSLQKLASKQTDSIHLQKSYDLGNILPITIGPKETAHVLAIGDRTVQFIEISNPDKEKNFLWPTNKDILPTEWIGLCRISNHSEKIVFNILARFEVEFLEHGPGGRFLKETLSSAHNDVAIESIKIGNDFPIYFVNQSKYDVTVKMPDKVLLEVQGKQGKFSVQLKPRDLIFPVDQLPPSLGPSSYDWSGKRKK